MIDLQKSNYGNFYYLNFKIFIQELFGKIYEKNKKLIKLDIGNISLRHPNKYSSLLDLDNTINNDERKQGLRELFSDFIVPLSNNTSSKSAIISFYEKGELYIDGAVKKRLGIPLD